MRIALLALVAWPVCAQTFPVSGLVVDSESGLAVRRVRVVLGMRPPTTVVTGDDGKFEFQAPKGKFGFYAEKLGWRQVFGGGFGSAVITGPIRIPRIWCFAGTLQERSTERWWTIAAIRWRRPTCS